MQGFNIVGFQPLNPLVITIVVVWSAFWKGIALWRSAQSKQLYWFVAMLIINSLGVLEIVYLFAFAKKKLTGDEIKSWLQYIKR